MIKSKNIFNIFSVLFALFVLPLFFVGWGPSNNDNSTQSDDLTGILNEIDSLNENMTSIQGKNASNDEILEKLKNTKTNSSEYDYLVAYSDSTYTITQQNSTTVTAPTIEEGVLTITQAGSYYISGGELKQIVVGKSITDAVNICLDKVTISQDSATAPCVDVGKGTSNVNLTLVNTNAISLTTSTSKVYAIQTKGNLSINGTGTLNITTQTSDEAEKASAIKVKNTLAIVDATIVADCSEALKTNAIACETLIAKDATITVSGATKDAINAEIDDDNIPSDYSYTNEYGYVYFNNVNFTATNILGDGIQADSYVSIVGGTYKIASALISDSMFTTYATENTNSNIGTGKDYVLEDFKFVKSNGTYKRIAKDEISSKVNNTTLYALTQSVKGIKVGEIDYDDANGDEQEITTGDYMIYIDGGVFKIDTIDDAIHTNCGDVLINGGVFEISTYDDGLTADENMIIRYDSSQTTEVTANIKSSLSLSASAKTYKTYISITKCYEGIEGSNIVIGLSDNISDELEINIVSDDDGINASDGNSQTTSEVLAICGGKLTVTANGDGLDSNGYLTISGGEIVVVSNGNGDTGIDSDNGIVIDGGEVVVISTKSMPEVPSTKSAQRVLMLSSSNSVSENTTIAVKNGNNTIISAQVPVSISGGVCITVSSQNISSGQTYTFYSGSTSLGSVTSNSQVSTSGVNTQNGGGNGMNFGDMNGGGQFGGQPHKKP